MNHVPSIETNPALTRLTAQVKHDLDCLDYPARNWVRPRTHESGLAVYDAVIIGGGQSGLAAAFGLMREKITNILVLDECPEGLEGPWESYARMVTLRTPKHLTALDFGMPNLTFRAYWEAQHGAEGWAALGKIPRPDWMRYLRWFRRTLDIPVRNDTRLDLIEPLEPGLFRLHVSGAAVTGTATILARKVILATGIQGGGEWHTPSFIREALPKSRYAHTSEAIDYAAMQGQRIGILGGGASAFDNAQWALGEGVASVDLFIRRAALPRINPIRYMENAGFLGHFADLDDATKYRAIDHFIKLNQPPTNDTFNRARAYPGFSLHLGAPWTEVHESDQGVVVTTPKGRHVFDFLVLSTGMLTDAKLRPELAALAPQIACWRDMYTPPEGQANRLVDDHPYLGADFSFTGLTPQGQAQLHGLFAFNYSALASLGLSASALSGMKFALPRLINGVARQLFTDDQDAIMAGYYDYADEEFLG
jgi:cation diffusion facilitator CzcD-associated flavoprotein CzcO